MAGLLLLLGPSGIPPGHPAVIQLLLTRWMERPV